MYVTIRKYELECNVINFIIINALVVSRLLWQAYSLIVSIRSRGFLDSYGVKSSYFEKEVKSKGRSLFHVKYCYTYAVRYS